jgi:hypothetical protein
MNRNDPGARLAAKVRRTALAGSACVLMLAANAISAKTIIGTYTGHTISTEAEQDFPGVWGVDAFGNNIIGDNFSATFQWNLADGVTTVVGGQYSNLQTPGTATGTFTINGHTYDVPTSGGFASMLRSSNFFEIERTGDPAANSGDFFEVGTIPSIDPRLDQPIFLSGADLDPASNSGDVVLGFAGAGILRANFVVDSIRLDAVPEPATWSLLIAGFGMIGASQRRRLHARSPSILERMTP